MRRKKEKKSNSKLEIRTYLDRLFEEEEKEIRRFGEDGMYVMNGLFNSRHKIIPNLFNKKKEGSLRLKLSFQSPFSNSK